MHKVIEEITESNNWRDGEFAKFKLNPANLDKQLWFRMCIPMIYAHWEGFVVSSLKILIRYLNSLELKPDSVRTHLIVVGLGASYRSLSGKQSFKQRVEFTDRFSSLYKNSLKFAKKVDTKSNLKSTVLEELCEMFGFDFANFTNYTSDIDRLVNIRNSIAHGENSVIPDRENIEKYITVVVSAMDALVDEMQKFLDEEEYLVQKTA
ncbi:MAG: MAE_28990/MAE_18760 family HEPN-like nuclease [Wenzhouxiangella sp.]